MTQFHPQPKGLTVREIVALTGAKPRDGVRLDAVVTGIAALDRARRGDLTFLDDEKFAGALAMTRAGVCITTGRLAGGAPETLIVLQSPDPFRDFVMVARALYPDSLRPRSLFHAQAVAPGAIVHPTAEIEDGVIVDPGAVIGPRAGIGSGTVIAANAVIGPDVQIGRDCSVGPGASIVHALIGDSVILRGGCRIGQDGRRDGPQVPQLGRVIIQDRVEIGANATIDRGSARDTWIGEGATIDNLVQIGHNCTVGRNCIIGAKIAVTTDVAAGEKRLG